MAIRGEKGKGETTKEIKV